MPETANETRPLTFFSNPLPVEIYRLVLEAVVEKKLVVVALEPVAFTKVKFCKVEEPLTRRVPSWAIEPKRLVEEAVVEKMVVVVALVVVEFPVIKRFPAMVEEAAEAMKPPVEMMIEVVALCPTAG